MQLYGIETEYGIYPGKHLDVETASRACVEAVAELEKIGLYHTRWDHSGLRPLSKEAIADLDQHEDIAQIDSQGKQLPVPSQEVPRLSPQEEKFQRTSNKALSNGARYYVDHSHPEYATAETTSTLCLAAADSAGAVIVAKCAQIANRKRLCHEGQNGETTNVQNETISSSNSSASTSADIRIIKNNVDGKGQAYGTHENYLLPREIEIESAPDYLAAFLVTRVIFAGSGRVGIGEKSTQPGFQISQRADYIEQVISLTTTVNRGILNTRDEPHACPSRWRRFHYIGGDANCFPYVTWLKTTITGMVLKLFSLNLLPAQDLALADPVQAAKIVSQDLSCHKALLLKNSREMSAVQIQQAYAKLLQAYPEWTPLEQAALQEYQLILREFENNSAATPPASLADRVEWIAKYYTLSALLKRKHADFSSVAAQGLDLQWAELDSQRGLAQVVGKKFKTLDDFLPLCPQIQEIGAKNFSELVEYFTIHAPLDTRAYFRGAVIARFPQQVAAANWHSLVLDGEDEYLQRVCLSHPLQWNRELMKETLNSPTMKQIVDQIAIRPADPLTPRYGNLSY